MTIRTAYLVRLSRDDLKTPGSIEEKFALRLAMCDELADRYGLPRAEEPDRYVEQISGGKLSKRPIMRDCLEKCQTRYYTHLISPYQDRILRGDKRDEADIEDALIDGEITLVTFEGLTTFDDTYDSSHALTFEVRAAAARHYRRDIINKLKQSNRQRAMQGQKSAGLAPYGYRWVNAEYANRRMITAGHYEIIGDLDIADDTAARQWFADNVPNTEYSPDGYLTLARSQSLPGGGLLPGVVCTGGEYFHVCEIFRRIQTEGYQQLLVDFNTRRVPPPSATRFENYGGTHWHNSTFRNIIKNRHYSGFPTHTTTMDRHGRKIPLTPERWVMPDTEMPYPHPIRLPFQEALLEKISARSASGAPRLQSEVLLTGLLRCSHGNRMRSNYHSYNCRCAEQGNPHTGSYIRAENIEKLIVLLAEKAIASIPEEAANRKSKKKPAGGLAESSPVGNEIQRLKQDREDLRRIAARNGNPIGMMNTIDDLTQQIDKKEKEQKAARASEETHNQQEALHVLLRLKKLGFRETWEKIDIPRKREVLGIIFENITLPETERKSQRITSFTVEINPFIRKWFNPGTVKIQHRRHAPSEIIID